MFINAYDGWMDGSRMDDDDDDDDDDAKRLKSWVIMGVGHACMHACTHTHTQWERERAVRWMSKKAGGAPLASTPPSLLFSNGHLK